MGETQETQRRLSKQLALGLLEDAMGRAEQQRRPEQQTGPEQQRQARADAAALPGARCRRRPCRLPDAVWIRLTSRLTPAPAPAAGEAVPRPRQRGAERTGKSTRHSSLG